jgi:hypothetical protein
VSAATEEAGPVPERGPRQHGPGVGRDRSPTEVAARLTDESPSAPIHRVQADFTLPKRS